MAREITSCAVCNKTMEQGQEGYQVGVECGWHDAHRECVVDPLPIPEEAALSLLLFSPLKMRGWRHGHH